MRKTALFALLLVLAGCQTETKETYEFSFSEKQEGTVLDSRLERLVKQAKEYPKRSDLPYQMAGIYYQKQEFREAAKALERAIAIDSREAKYHYHLGRVYLRMRELDPAEAAFRRAVDLMPSDRYTGGHAALGYVLCQKGQWEAARAEFKLCNQIDPDDVNPYYFLGCIDDVRKDSRSAIANLKEYLKRGGVSYRSKAIEILQSYGVEPPPLPAPRIADAAPEKPLREGVIRSGPVEQRDQVLGQDFGEFPGKAPGAPAAKAPGASSKTP